MRVEGLGPEDVIWAYRLCLGREPESPGVIEHWRTEARSRQALMRALMSSDEYKSKSEPAEQTVHWHYHASFDAAETITRHAKTSLKASANHVTNFLGVKIRPDFFPSILAGLGGTVQAPPIPANWHADMAEWASCLRAVDLSGDRFAMMELGCGWGCWMNNLGVAAKSAGKSIRLFGIEADETHFGYAQRALADNGMLDGEFSLIRGIAGRGSVALFPQIESGINWGGSAIFDPSSAQLEDAIASGTYVTVPIIDIASVLKDEKRLDLLHVDIQGAELGLLTEMFDLLNRKVAYVFVGTHSKQIEAGLFDLFTSSGDWKLEMERAAIFRLDDGRPIVIGDGVQAWRNCGVDQFT